MTAHPAQTFSDMVQAEVLANSFQAIVDDAAFRIMRSAYTTWIKESQDFATALVSTAGEIVTFPHAVGAKGQLGLNIGPLIASHRTWSKDDVVITNDPYLSGGVATHLNDMHLITPIFDEADNLIAYFWGFLHCTDVGGAVPGSVSVHNKDIYQEGFRLRPVKLFESGALNALVRDVIRDNSRNRDDIWGDISALAAAVRAGARQVEVLAKRHGSAAVSNAMVAALDACEGSARAAISLIPIGSYSFSEYFEDDRVSGIPLRIAVTMSLTGDGTVSLDFSESDPSVLSALNIPTGGQAPNHPFVCRALITFVATYGTPTHLNGGLMRCFHQIVPDGSVLHAEAPSACGARFASAIKVHEAVLGCLVQAVPDMVPASGGGQLSQVSVSIPGSGAHPGRVVAANPVQGGAGGGPDADGVSGSDRTAGFLQNIPIEILEGEAPVVVHGYRLVPDSEGAGTFRGGFGIALSLEVTAPGASLVVRGQDRHLFQPWGVRGGDPGANARCWVEGEGQRRELGNAEFYTPKPHEVVTVVGAGGGGYGPPRRRALEAVLRDLEAGLISVQKAAAVYGVVDGARAVQPGQDPVLATPEPVEFSFGENRARWQWRVAAVQRRITQEVWSVPPAQRGALKAQIYRELETRVPSGPFTEAQLEEVLHEIADVPDDRTEVA